MDYEPLKKKYLRRLKGHTRYPRQEILFLRFYLNDQQYILYTLIRDITVDWDKSHDMFGHFIFDPDQLASYSGWSVDKVKRTFRSLIKKGFALVIKRTQQIYQLRFYGQFQEMQAFDQLKIDPFKYIKDISEDFVTNTQAKTNIKINFADLQKQISSYIDTTTGFNSKSSTSSKVSSNDLIENNYHQTGNEDVDFEELMKDIKL